MNRNDLYNSFNDIDDDILERSETVMRSRKKFTWLKWGALAACLCLTVMVVLPRALPENFEEIPDVPPSTDTETIPGNTSDVQEEIFYGPPSDTYASLPELLAYLSSHEDHGDNRTDALGGYSPVTAQKGTDQSEEARLIENTGVAVNVTGEYSYHIGDSSIYISRLDGRDTENVGTIDLPANALFTCNNNLLVVSRYQSDGDELNLEMSVRLTIFDISAPHSPVCLDEYTQTGDLTACWMVGADLYIVTSDGVCACGWSRLDDVSGYYPALFHNGESIEWGDEDISILGDPTRVQYSAISVINGNIGELTAKKALYGNIQKLFYGEDWITAVVAGETKESRDNPVLYTFGGNLNFTGKINPAQIMVVPEQNILKDYKPQNGTYLDIVSVTKADGVYRILGTDTVLDKENAISYFMAIAANEDTGETNVRLLSAENYPYSSFSEILWEPNRAIACISTMNHALTTDMAQETRFIFVDFDGLEIQFQENELRADYLYGRVGVAYGSPLEHFKTLIPLGQGIYIRYSHPSEGPGGFDVFDFSDSALPELLYRADTSLSGEDAFDYFWQVYDEHTFGTLKVLLGDEDYFRNVRLSWCVYSVDPSNQTMIALQSEQPLDGEIKTFLGADGIGFVVFEAGENLYYATKDMKSATKISVSDR